MDMNKPVAWMNESNWMGGIQLDVITDEFKQSGKGGDCSEYHIPLYTHPVELTDEEIHAVWASGNYYTLDKDGSIDEFHFADFAKAILRKAQEK